MSTTPFDHTNETDPVNSVGNTELGDIPEPEAIVYQIPVNRGVEPAQTYERSPWFDNDNVLRGISLVAKAAAAFALLNIVDEIWRNSGR